MKPLLITFFAAILCYSLFIERRDTPIHIDDINYTIQAESFDTLRISDPTVLYTENLYGLNDELIINEKSLRR